ncbi:MAG: tripartite tricarboxylate transporter substrate binding protein [Casimicrobium sp.]
MTKNFSLTRRTVLQSAALMALPTWAQSWPARPLRWVVPFPPGGTTDVVTRLIATEISRSLGQPVVVENKPGAGTVIGVDTVAKAPADGYTMITVANSFCANQTLVKNLPYDSVKDFSPVALMGLSEHVLVANPSLGAKTLAEFSALVRRQPGKISYASFGNGTSAHLSGAMLESELQAPMIHVPYKGQAPALTDVLGGQVNVMFGNWPEFRGHVKSGKLIALGMATAQRSSFAPEVPTLAEQGLKLESNSWNGVLMRAGTSDVVLARIHAEIQAALQAPTVVAAFKESGIAAQPGSQARFAAFIASETAKYANVIRKANIRIDN